MSLVGRDHVDRIVTRGTRREALGAARPRRRGPGPSREGVLAGHAAWRSEVVPKPVPDKAPELRPKRVLSPMQWIDGGSVTWMPWADLLERVFHVAGFRCPACGQPMKVRCLVQGRATRTVVEGLVKATGPP